MANRKLDFQEISDNEQQACVDLDCGYKIQVIYDTVNKLYSAKLYDYKGSMVEGSDNDINREELEDFINESETLVELYKESEVSGALGVS